MSGYLYKGRHRKPTNTKRRVTTVAGATLIGAVGSTGLATAETSSMASMPPEVRAAIISCESGGQNVATKIKPPPGQVFTASGFYQITNPTWRDNGGLAFASRAMFASRAQQDIVADRIFAARGTQPWDSSRGCWSKRIGAKAPTSSINAAKRTKAARAAKPSTSANSVRSTKPDKTRTYTVKSGDTLTNIAAAQGVKGGFRVIFEKNRDVVENPNRIFPGEVLRLS